MAKKRRKPGVAMGTDAGFSQVQKDCLRVRIFFGMNPKIYFVPQMVTFVYEDEETASKADAILESRLESRADFSSDQLARKYSVENILEFLKNHLMRDGMLAVQWTGIVRLRSDGLQCLLPSETWSSMHFEDLLDSEIEWNQGKADNSSSENVTLLHRRFGLSPAMVWLARTRVSRSVTDFDFFGDGQPD